MPRGRERVLDEGKQREVCALISSGCSLQAAAHYVECAPNTIRREANRNPDFGRRFREARLQAQLSPLQAMRKAAASHWRAAAWMLERGDPEHFARRPPPAFRPKQAQALRDDITAILSAEIENPFLLSRVKKQVQHLIEYSIDGVVSVERTDRQLRAVMRDIDEWERKAAKCDFHGPLKEPLKEKSTSAPSATSPAAKSDVKSNHRSQGNCSQGNRSERSAPSAPGVPKSGPTNPDSGPTNTPQPSNPAQPSNAQQLDPEIAGIPVTWGDMTKVFQRLQNVAKNSSTQNADCKPATVQSANGKPGAAPPEMPPTSASPSESAVSPPQPATPTG